MNGSFYILVHKTFMHPVEKVVQQVFVDGWSLLIILYIYRLDKTLLTSKISVLDEVNFIKYSINIFFSVKNLLLI